MSTIRTPPSLKWLITKRARLLGDLLKLREALPLRLAELRTDVVEAERALAQAEHRLEHVPMLLENSIQCLEVQLHALDVTLGLHEIPINPDLIPPIRTQESGRIIGHGELTRGIFTGLRLAKGEALTTTALALYVASRHGLELEGAEFLGFREKIRYRLKTLCREGKVCRLHLAKTQLEGRWALPAAVTRQAQLSFD
ncbi:hypothetical protein LQR30_11760 [Chromobacterium piscinae]|uniref:hypothetical protein n=1 Tax=Chromobacterium piscinae TaxID=686831 RepID=UPI001E5B35CC|nr:hypothetical protein [Chromobacterium piscinae]MCD4504781.1 hypothetical protein [Chromobacterium piscinae]